MKKNQNKAARLEKAKQQYAKFLMSVGYTGEKGSQARFPIPDYNCDRNGVSPTSNSIAGGGTKKDTTYKIEESKNYTVAPAFNKGGYQVVSKQDIKDIGR